MSKTFFIADTHFGSKAILGYESRPFDTVEQMDKAIVENWNKVVSPQDTVWHLGDVGDDTIIGRLNGIKYLVKGNHDTGSNQYYRDIGFTEVYDLPVLFENFWLLSHEPLYINSNMPYANLFGHVHANPIIKDLSSQHFCVCVERIDYTPVEFDFIKKAIADAAK
ncbi:MAG: phosphoesterase [Clostridia bacterium]|nr:phosphoesterase [Clostridia bacterium]